MTFSRRHSTRQTPMVSTMRDSGFVVRHAVESLDDLRAGTAEPEDEPAAGHWSMLAALAAMVIGEREKTFTMLVAS